MTHMQVRRLSIVQNLLKRFNPSSAVESPKPLTSLPLVTGAGAFIEPVSYQVLGSSHDLLNIKLPKSSILNIRYSNKQQKIVALNGKINSLYTEITKLDSNIVFQRCFNEKEPMSLLIAQNSQNSNFAVVETNKTKWLVKKNSLFAWSGTSIKPSASKHSKLAQITGDGTFVVSSPGQITQLVLDQNESIQVNSNVILGFTFDAQHASDIVNSTKNSTKSFVNLSIGKVPLSTRVTAFTKLFQLPEVIIADPTFKKIQVFLANVFTTIRKANSYFIGKLPKVNQKEVFVELKGPKTILISNSVQLSDNVLSDEQMKLLAE